MMIEKEIIAKKRNLHFRGHLKIAMLHYSNQNQS